MKKTVLLLTLLMSFCFVNAQNSKVVSANNYFNNKQLDKAKLFIDEASVHEQTKNKAKTWFYKGNIYLEIHLVNIMTKNLRKGMTKEEIIKVLREPISRRYVKVEGEKLIKWSYEYDVALILRDEKLESWNEPREGQYKVINKDALPEAYNSYQTCIKFDEKKEFYQQAKFKLYICGEQFYNLGVEEYNKKEYINAIEYFDKTISVNTVFGLQDSLATYNAAISAELSKQYDKAKKYYTKLIQMNYSKSNIYSSLSNIYKEEGDTLKALKTIQHGRKLFPGDFNLLILETNIYLNLGEEEKAQKNLEIAIERDPENANLHYVVGTQYFEKLKEIKYENDSILFKNIFNTAEKYLKNSIDLRSDYFEALFNLGALYVNEGVRIFEIAQTIDPNDFESYNIEKEKFDGLWRESIIYMEKASEVQPNDKETLITLKQLYARMKMMDKLKIVNEKIIALDKK